MADNQVFTFTDYTTTTITDCPCTSPPTAGAGSLQTSPPLGAIPTTPAATDGSGIVLSSIYYPPGFPSQTSSPSLQLGSASPGLQTMPGSSLLALMAVVAYFLS